MRDFINQKAQAIDITLSLPYTRSNEWPLILHPCITSAIHLHTLKLEIAYHCGWGFWSDYVRLTPNDLTSLACCPNLRHFKFVQNNESGSYTDPDEYFDHMSEELSGMSQLNLAEMWPVLESIHFDVGSYHGDFISLNIRTLPSTCHTLTCKLHEEQFADIPSSVTTLNNLVQLSEQCLMRLSTSDAVRESSLLSFTSINCDVTPETLSLLPASLTDVDLPYLGRYILDRFNSFNSSDLSMRHLVNLKNLDLGVVSLKDLEEASLVRLSKILPCGLSVLRCKLSIGTVPMHWDRPNDERIKLVAKYFAARLEIENYDESGAPK